MPGMLWAQMPKVKNDPTHDDKPIHFGFSLGLNVMDYKIEHSEAARNDGVFVGLKGLSPGINIHAISNLRLAENFDLRALPGISFGERYMYFENISEGDSSLVYGNPYKAESSYLELPILIKYKSKRLNNFRPYLIGGVNIRYDLSIKGEYSYDIDNAVSEQLIMLSKPDFFGEIGYGMDFYLTYFKFGLEVKYSFGLTNLIRREDNNGLPPAEIARYTDYIDRISSHIVIVSFHFE